MHKTPKTTRKRVTLPFLEPPAKQYIKESVYDLPAEVAARLIRVSSYHEFATSNGHVFSRACVYDHCQAGKILNVTIDGVIFIALTASAFKIYEAFKVYTAFQ